MLRVFVNRAQAPVGTVQGTAAHPRSCAACNRRPAKNPAMFLASLSLFLPCLVPTSLAEPGKCCSEPLPLGISGNGLDLFNTALLLGDGAQMGFISGKEGFDLPIEAGLIQRVVFV